jgi:catechol 2,3-dioxygenase-like lactoylglutathione lyase family enzyme
MECLIDHIVLNVEDVDKMTAFYAEVLAMPAERLDDFKAGRVPFPSVRLNADTIIDLFPKNMWPAGGAGGRGIGNLNHFCVAMDKGEWDALLERLEGSGVTLEEGPVARWGAHGTGTSVYFRDPEGNVIEARYYEARTGGGKCLLGS